MFGITALVIVVMSFLAIRALSDAGQSTEKIASTAMEKRVQQTMMQTVESTAAINSLIFGTVVRQVENAASYAADLFDHPQNYTRTWKFDERAIKLPAGQYGNAADEAGSLTFPNNIKLTAHNKQVFETIAHLDDVFPSILKHEPNAAAIYYEGTQSEGRYYPNIELAKVLPPDIDGTAQEFYTIVNPTNDPGKATKWTSVYNDPAGSGLLITASHPVYTAAGTFSGIVGLDVTLGDIAANIEKYSPIESSYAFLIDDQSRAIALPAQGYHDILGRAPKPKEFGSNLATASGDFRTILGNMRAGRKGFVSAQTPSQKLYVAYAPVAGTSFSLGLVAHQDAVSGVVSDLSRQVASARHDVLYRRIIPASIILLLIAWFLAYSSIRRMSDPIKVLTEKTARIANGDLNVEPADAHPGNELGRLAAAFNTMVAELKTSKRKIEEQNHALLHNEQTRLKASINSLNVGFIMTDAKNAPIMINDVAGGILGRAAGRADAPAGHHWSLTEIDAALKDTLPFKETLEKVLETGRSVERKEVPLGDRIYRIFVAPIRDDADAQPEHLGAVVLIEDITGAKQLERSRTEFFSIASHELRTPLTAIRGNSALIQQIYADQMKDADFAGLVDDIHGASVRLIEIVNDFLDATRLEQNRVSFENAPVLVHEVAQAVATELATVAKDKANEIKVSPAMATMPAVYADKNRVKQIIYNLLGNAMKFTEHGTITIDARIQGKKLKILIVDTGPGISAAEQRLLFHKFQQSTNNFTTRESRGTGLGLYISKLLSEQMGGRISLDHSEPGKGSTFAFTLPIATPKQIGEKAP